MHGEIWLLVALGFALVFSIVWFLTRALKAASGAL